MPLVVDWTVESRQVKWVRAQILVNKVLIQKNSSSEPTETLNPNCPV